MDLQSRKTLTILILATLALLCQAQYTDLIEITVPKDATDIDFSANHQFLGIDQQSALFIYNGHTGQFKQRILVAEEVKLSAFKFSNDGSLLTLGLNDGSVLLYEYSSDSHSFVDTGREYTAELQSKITSICFSFDKKYAVIGQIKNNFIVWDLYDEFIETEFDGQFVFSVACGSNSNYFAVGGGSGSTSKLSLFEVQSETSNFTLVHEFQAEPTETIFDITFSEQDSKLSSVGKKNFISMYELSNYSEEKIKISDDTGLIAQKIRISQNSQYIIVGQQAKQGDLVTVLKDKAFSQNFNSEIPKFGLSSSGDNLVYTQNTKEGKGSLASLCFAGYYYEEDACQPCKDSCALCQSAAGDCYQCTNGHYLQDNTCKKCMVGCLFCQNDQLCEQCDVASHFVLQNATCICEERSFLYEQMCVPCAEGCLQCDSLDNCHKCDQQNGFELHDGICSCSQGYYDDSGVCKSCGRGCSSCENQQYCYSCDQSSHYILKNRLCACDGDKHFIDDGENCVCEQGFFLKEDTCQKCIIGCHECDNSDTCNICYDGFHIEDGICVCDDAGQYIDQGEKCENCNVTLIYCNKCENPFECQSCAEGVHRHIKSGECICDDGYYNDESNVCQLCSLTGCLTCIAADICTQCDQSGHWIIDDSICKCQQRYTQVENTCVHCSIGCLTCTPNECQQCDAANHWQSDGAGACQCVKGFYEQGDTCSKCMNGCLECDSADTCQTCDASVGFILQDGKCVCKAGDFPKEDKCLQCINFLAHCQTCSSQTSCNTCLKPFILEKGKCTCEKGYFVDGDKCSKCGDACLQCTGPKQCTQCENGYKLQNGVCKKQNPVLKPVLVIALVLFLADIIFRLLK